MPKLLIKYLSILIFMSAIFSSDYKNLILIEFDNVSQNTVYDYFQLQKLMFLLNCDAVQSALQNSK